MKRPHGRRHPTSAYEELDRIIAFSYTREREHGRYTGMKTFFYASIVALLALSWPAVAQVPSTPTTATLTDTGVPDGIAFYNGRPFLIRNGRATLIDATLVPNGKILTNDGKLVGMPMNYGGFAQQPGAGPVVQPGQPTPQGQAGTVPNQPGTIGVSPQAGAAGKMDPKNPGAGATTD